jgi:hypothetical protein
MRSKPRRWDAVPDDDPLAGLVNLFDLWMVFSIALLLALVAASRLPELSQFTKQSRDETLPTKDSSKLEQFRVSTEKLTGEGQRLGTAYRLKNGEVVYVPD